MIDIRDYNALKTIFSCQKFDIVVHLAAMAGVRQSIETPALYYDVNVIGTLNLLMPAKSTRLISSYSHPLHLSMETTQFHFVKMIGLTIPYHPMQQPKKLANLCVTHGFIFMLFQLYA